MKSNVLQIPNWLPSDAAQPEMSVAAWNLLSHTDSLTTHLRELTHNSIRHCLLAANWGHPTAIERQALKLENDERTWIRSIEWRRKNQLWVHARAVFPESTIKATGTKFPGLGIQSLGEIIFKDPELKRDPFFFSLLGKDSVYYSIIPEIIDATDTVWARRSILHYQDHPILITEIFMPESYAQSNA
ncbi:MAG: chorismate lyase [Coxiellaceae bacterium]|nr:chorismate lyase [Coxiellaceae bacterium]